MKHDRLRHKRLTTYLSIDPSIQGNGKSAENFSFMPRRLDGITLPHRAGFWSMNFSFLIWTVLHDRIEPYKGPIRFQLQFREIPVFGIANVLVREERSTRSYIGGHSGMSIRIASGLYYHLGGIRGHAAGSTSLQEVDYGDFLMTTQAIYFGGTERGINFRPPYNQIIRFQPYSDAVGICRNDAREQIFAPQRATTNSATRALQESGWFLFNILQALAAKGSGNLAH